MDIMRRKGLLCSRKTLLLVIGIIMSGVSCGITKELKHHQHRSHHHHHEKDVHSTPSHRVSKLHSGYDDVLMRKHATHEGRFDHSVTETANENATKMDEACLHVHCSPGRICSPDPSTALGAVCRCPDDRHCQRQAHRRKGRRVCGSDGRFYDNRCELHRQACLAGEGIRVVRDEGICQRRKRVMNDDDDDERRSSLSSVSSHSSAVKDHPHANRDERTRKRHHPHANPAASRRQSNVHLLIKEDLTKKHQFHDDPSSKPSLEAEEQKHVELPGQDQQLNMENVEEKGLLACTREDLEKMVKGLMRQKCIRTGNKDCDNSTEWHQRAANDLFADLDFNSDLSLELVELYTDERPPGDQSKVCRLQDLFTFYDTNQDTLLSLAEFYSALGVLEEEIQVLKMTVVVGTHLELRCDSLNGTGIIWRRNERTLSEIYNDDIKVLGDGSLYVREVTLSHIGNYSCVDRISHEVIRSHMVQVQVFPIVRVSPLTQFHTSGSTSTLRCHSDGVPRPRLSWDFNESPVPNHPDHYLLLQHNHTLLIKDSQYLKDTGAFKCKAHNAAGTSQDIATVFVENSDVPKYGRVEDPYELFLVFHDDGYSVHEPSHCHIQHVVTGTFKAFKFRPDIASENYPVESLCEPNRTCSWGDAVNVQNKFIYVSQPNLNRIVVIEIRDRFNPVEIIAMDQVPVQVDYINHLDEIWVTCWSQTQRDGASKTSLIIRQASSGIQHHTIHTQPMQNSFAQFSAIYLPLNSALNHHFRYGYAVDSTNATTYKVDLVAKKVAHVVNLGCNPIAMAFVALGGKVVVNCGSHARELVVVDYLTDEVLETLNVTGDPYVSPDSRFLVTVDNALRKISVFTVSDEGAVAYSFDVNLDFTVSDVAFLASDTGYDFFASSSNGNGVLCVDLSTRLVESLEGVGEAPGAEEWPWSRVNRVIVAGGIFSDYLMSPSSESVVVIDAKRRHLQCEWAEMTSHANVIVWTEVSKL